MKALTLQLFVGEHFAVGLSRLVGANVGVCEHALEPRREGVLQKVRQLVVPVQLLKRAELPAQLVEELAPVSQIHRARFALQLISQPEARQSKRQQERG